MKRAEAMNIQAKVLVKTVFNWTKNERNAPINDKRIVMIATAWRQIRMSSREFRIIYPLSYPKNNATIPETTIARIETFHLWNWIRFETHPKRTPISQRNCENTLDTQAQCIVAIQLTKAPKLRWSYRSRWEFQQSNRWSSVSNGNARLFYS